MTREQQEMAVWRRVFERWYSREEVEQFRKRYPVAPTVPAPVWYDEPPFEKIDKTNLCWVENIDSPQAVYWSDATNEWWVWIVGGAFPQPLAGRRVSPIIKPPEPTQ